MSTFAITCPKCGAALEAEEKYLGFLVACADCDHHFTLWTPENNLPHYSDELEQFKPGILAKVGLPLSFRSSLFTEEQLALLLSEEDTKRIFHFSFPLLRPLEEGTEINGNRRYWSEPVELFGKKYLISKEWFDYNRKLIISWLRQMKVAYSELLEKLQSANSSGQEINQKSFFSGLSPIEKFQFYHHILQALKNQNVFLVKDLLIISWRKFSCEYNIGFNKVEAMQSLVNAIKPYLLKSEIEEIPLQILPISSCLSPIGKKVSGEICPSCSKLSKSKNVQMCLKEEEKLIPLTNIDKTLTYTKPLRLFIGNNEYELSSWKDVLLNLVSYFMVAMPEKFNKLINVAFSKFTKRICIQTSPDNLVRASKISESLWLEINFSAHHIVRLSQEIAELCDYDLAAVQIVYSSQNDSVKKEITKETLHTAQRKDDNCRDIAKFVSKGKSIVSIHGDAEKKMQSLQQKTFMGTDPEFSVFSNFDFTFSVLQKLYANGFDFNIDARELQTIQWCQHNLNLRLPLLRKLRAFESADDYRESFMLLDDNSAWMICRLQDNLDRRRFLKWLQENNIEEADVADMLNVRVVKAKEVIENADVQSSEAKNTPVTDADLIYNAVTQLFKENLLASGVFSDLQTPYFCMQKFGLFEPVICRHFPYMHEEDYGKDYRFWNDGPQDTPYLILHNCEGFNKAEFLSFIEKNGIPADRFENVFNDETNSLAKDAETDCILDPQRVTCDVAICNFLDKHPGSKEQDIIAALTDAGHDSEKIYRRLERMEEISCEDERYYHRSADQEDISLSEQAPGKLVIQTYISNDEIDRMLLEYVTGTPGQKKEAVIGHLTSYDIPESRAESRLRKHSKIFCIVEQYYSADGIYGFEEAADIIWETLNDLFEQNNGYTSARELYRAVSGKLDDFFYDNDAFDSEVEIYQLAQYLFEKEQYKENTIVFLNKIHIWKEKPDYPTGDSGLLIHWAKGNNGILTTNAAYANLLRRGATEGSKTAIFSLAMDKVYDRFWMIDSGTFLLKDDIQITESQLQELKTALDTLYDAFDYDFIPMWDIADDWFESLPRIISGQSWTPMLLQSILRDYSTRLQYKTIPRIEQRQQHAAIVAANSEFKDYSDLVYHALKAEYQTPSIKIHRNELFDLLIKIGLWPEAVSPSSGNAFQNLFKDNFHFHVSDKNTVEVG